MSEADEVEERERQRESYLVAFYRLTADEPLRWATHREIAEAAGIPPEQIMAISMHLSQRHLVELRTMGGLDGSVELTSYGVAEAERAIKQHGSGSAGPALPSAQSEDEWIKGNRTMVEVAYKAFRRDLAWPDLDTLQRALDRQGTRIDVRQALVAMPKLEGELTSFQPMAFHLPLRMLRYLPEAEPVLQTCFELIQRAVELYFSDAEKLEISNEDSWLAVLPHPEEAVVASRLLLNDSPSPFAGGGYGEDLWRLTVNGTMVRKFQGLASIEEYFERQRQIRSDDFAQFAALAHRIPQAIQHAGSSDADLTSPTDANWQQSIFVIMPFGEEWSPGVYDFIKRAVGALGDRDPHVVRADEITKPGKIDEQIMQAIRVANCVVADITGSNANVMWELGYAQALLIPTVVMNQRVTDSPFDLASTRQVAYRLAPTNDDQAKLTKHIRAALDERRSSPE